MVITIPQKQSFTGRPSGAGFEAKHMGTLQPPRPRSIKHIFQSNPCQFVTGLMKADRGLDESDFLFVFRSVEFPGRGTRVGLGC